VTASPLPDALHCRLDAVTLIEASAGTGKTWTICQLYLRLLLERGLRVKEILVVTFTRAATAELRGRVRARLVEMQSELRAAEALGVDGIANLLKRCAVTTNEPGAKLQARLELAINEFDEAAIFTIHGFCHRVLAQTPLSSGLPFAMELIEDDRKLCDHVVADFWRKEILTLPADSLFTRYLYETRQTPALWAAMLAQTQSRPYAAWRWPELIDDESFDGDAAAMAEAMAAALERAATIWRRERGAILEQIVQALPAMNAQSYHAQSIADSAERWDALLIHRSASLFRVASTDKAQLLTSGMLRRRVRRNKQAPEHPFFDAAQATLESSALVSQASQRTLLRTLRSMLDQSRTALMALKHQSGVVSHDDLLFMTWRAVAHSEDGGAASAALAAQLRARYPAALIDEFQDTDPLQCGIFFAIYGDGTLPMLMVGDPKQAIYRFRNADLAAYLEAKKKAQAVYALKHNYRSVGGLVSAGNAFFSSHPEAFIESGIVYQSVAAAAQPRELLVDPADPPSEPGWRPLRLWRLPSEASGQALALAQARAWAIGRSADEIQRLLQAGVKIDGRALRAGEIAILVRTHREGQAMKAALQARGVASVELSQANVFGTTEAQDLERLLRVLLLPIRDPRRPAQLRALLASELLGWSSHSLNALASDDRQWQTINERFAQYRLDWQTHGFAFLFQKFLRDECIVERCHAQTNADRRLTNLMHLGELLQSAAQELDADAALVRWFSNQRNEPSARESSLLRLESDQNLVQIVTIHQSKGLEYGVVFCPLLWDASSKAGTTTIPLADRTATGELVLDFSPLVDDAKSRKARQREEDEAEAVRLMYVALTRAIHRCYLVVGTYRSGRTNDQRSHQRSHQGLLNWLVAGAGFTRAQWRERSIDRDEIDHAWAAFAERASPNVSLESHPPLLEALAPPALNPHQQDSGEMLAGTDSPRNARENTSGAPWRFPAADANRGETNRIETNRFEAKRSDAYRFETSWFEASFSSLVRGAHTVQSKMHGPAKEDRSGIHRTPALGNPSDLDEDDILRFPAGADAGECLHAILEQIDFTQAQSWPAVVDRSLSRFGIAEAPVQARRVQNLLRDALATPLPGGFRLEQISPAQRLIELEFRLHLAPLSAPAWNTWLRDQGLSVPLLAFLKPARFLQGFIDLVVEANERFFVIDWKSNRLGYRSQDYERTVLETPMAEQGYHLQALLYTLALHRYLRRRLAHYDYDTHLGGSLTLFLRGLRPNWLDPKGAPTGVVAQRFARHTIESLDALLTPLAPARATT